MTYGCKNRQVHWKAVSVQLFMATKCPGPRGGSTLTSSPSRDCGFGFQKISLGGSRFPSKRVQALYKGKVTVKEMTLSFMIKLHL